MSAFLLQGLEAAFTYALIVASEKYDFDILANEHDGVVAEGEIPHDAIQLARFVSGFHSAELVAKAFVTSTSTSISTTD